MESEPRPVEIRHAVIGAVLIAVALYVGGGAIWTWLFWEGQSLDASRVGALVLAWVAFMGGLTLIQRWLAGEWFEGRRRRSSDYPVESNFSGSNHQPNSDGSAPGGDSGAGSN